MKPDYAQIEQLIDGLEVEVKAERVSVGAALARVALACLHQAQGLPPGEFRQAECCNTCRLFYELADSPRGECGKLHRNTHGLAVCSEYERDAIERKLVEE